MKDWFVINCTFCSSSDCDYFIVRETSCPGNVLSGKRRGGKRLVRETSVREMSCPGNVW